LEEADLSKNFELLQRAQREQESVNSNGSSGASVSLGDVHQTSLRTSRNGHFVTEEAVRLVHRLFLVPGPEVPRVVLFSGVDPGDGCSTVCVQVAETLASEVGVSGSFCVVDANLRDPSLHDFFAVENRVGLVDALGQTGPVRDFLQQVDSGRLWVMTAGSKTSNIHGLIGSEALRVRINELRSEFDNVLIDSPPVNRYADACSLGKLADGVILVLQSNATRREAARKAKETLESAHVRLLGAVLNKRRFPVPDVIYGRV
jgi:protein-tyrosine kinase